MALLAQRIAALGTENAFKVGGDIAQAQALGQDVIKFNLGEPDFDSAPHINLVGCAEINSGNSHYCDPTGLPAFRESIARFAGELRGMNFDPEQIVVTPGAKPPIGYSMLSYINAGDEVVYPSPGFPIYESFITFVGAIARPLHLREEKGFAFSAEDLEPLLSEKTKLIIINSPSNPTGGVLSPDDLSQIAAVIREKCSPDVRVFSDEVYDQILFDGETHHTIANLEGMAERTIIGSGHSKAYAMTGWRLGFAILPTVEEARVFKQLNINLVSCVPPFVQLAGKEAYDNPESTQVVAHMNAEFQIRRDIVVEGLNAIDGVSCQTPRGAFYVFPNIGGVCESIGALQAHQKLDDAIRSKTSPSTLVQMYLIYRHGVATMDRRSFGAIGSESMHFLRLSIATDLESLKTGIERMRTAFSDRDGFARFVAEGKYLY